MYQKIKKNKKQKAQPIEYKNLNPFKAEEKRYKQYQGHETDYSELIDVAKLDEAGLAANLIQKDGPIYRFTYPQGVILIKEFLTLGEQVSISKLCMNDYLMPPYRTNLHIYKEDEDFSKSTTHSDESYHFNHKTRWTNVGYQYDWNNRKYPDHKTEVPDPIQNISQRANAMLQMQPKYTSEAVIINFYQPHDYMTGHLDDAELDQISPIYSFSFGLSCVFLIGGPTKEERPAAIRLDSGDLLVMSGESRKAYHGVPRIIEGSFNYKQPYANTPLQGNLNSEFHAFNYLSQHRININTRQVYQQ